MERAGKDLSAMEKGKEDHCIKYCFHYVSLGRLTLNLNFFSTRYINHYGQWLPPHHFYICDVKIALTQIIGAGGPEALQGVPEEKLQLKIQLCQELLKIYRTVASGTLTYPQFTMKGPLN